MVDEYAYKNTLLTDSLQLTMRQWPISQTVFHRTTSMATRRTRVGLRSSEYEARNRSGRSGVNIILPSRSTLFPDRPRALG